MSIQRLPLLFAILILLLVTFHSATCKPSSTHGRHFVIGFMQNEIPRPDLRTTYYASIFISATQADTLTVRIANEEPQIIELAANVIREIKINDSLEINEIGKNTNKLIDIRSRHPVVCWAYSSKNESSDGFVALPVGVWGNEYRIVSMPNDLYNGKIRLCDVIDTLTGAVKNQERLESYLTPRSGEFLIIASFDSTVVYYTPTCDTRNEVFAGQQDTIILNAGECFLVQALEGEVGTEDLTGTLIESNNPIGVLSGHVRTAVMQGLDNPYDTKDHLLEMLPPTNTWGNSFISVPFIDGTNVTTNNYRLLCASGDLIKIVAKEDSTIIKYSVHNSNNAFTTHIDTIVKAGDVFEYESSQPVLWESDKQIMVSQFMMHKGNEDESRDYDPSYVILTPIEQYMSDVSFSTPSNNKIFEQYKAHCFVAIVDSASLKELLYDGQTLFDRAAVQAQQIGTSQYYWIMTVVKNGAHKLITSKGKFSGIIYGHGQRDSYAMTLGSRLTNPAKEDTIPPYITTIDSCGKINVTITDIIKNDSNATGIDWGYVKNVVNYNIKQFDISDTATVINFTAVPVDSTKDASFDIEFIDKNYNTSIKHVAYSGFNFSYQSLYDFGLLKWDIPTSTKLKITNNSSAVQHLLSIIQASDNRLTSQLSVIPAYKIAPNETIEIDATFTPNGDLTLLDTKVYLQFECNTIAINLKGKIAAPGLLAEDLNFGKVRLHESKTLTGKLHNAGNVSLFIGGIAEDKPEPVFAWQYENLFPYTMAIGEQFEYTVTFTPTELKTHLVNATVPNDNNADCQFYVQGIGASPDIQNIVLDWGKKRIGTISDTTISITNAGNFDDTVSYKADIALTHPADLSKDSIMKIIDFVIAEKRNENLSFSYQPKDTIQMENVFELASSWAYHRQISVTVKAQGTLPVIQKFNYSFGNVSLYSTKKAQHNAVLSAGNEALTIDSIALIGGDVGSFEIDYLQLYNVIIEPQNYCTIPITFAPSFVGEHKIYLEITHDANPNYLRGKDTIEITGICVAENTDLLVTLPIPTILSCQTTQTMLILENTGLSEIHIDSITISQFPTIIDANITLNGNVPTELSANEKLEFPVSIYAEHNENADLHINVYYNSGGIKRLTHSIEPQVAIINSTLIVPKTSVLPGEVLALQCKANILQKTENLFDYKIILRFDKNLFYCLEKNCYINVNSDKGNQVFEAKIEQYSDYVEFDLSNAKFEIEENNTTIEFLLPLQALLNLTKETEFVFELSSERCYDSAPFSLAMQVGAVCADSLRNIDFDKFPYMLLNQNPIENEIDLTINLLENDAVDLIITDILGNEICVYNQFFTKGRHNVSVPFNPVHQGEYFIIARSQQLNAVQKILLIKN